MRIVRLCVTTFAIIALVLTCLTCDPQGPRLSGEHDGGQVSFDLSEALPAIPSGLPLVPPKQSGSVHVDDRPLPSRLTTAEVFRPPRVRG